MPLQELPPNPEESPFQRIWSKLAEKEGEWSAAFLAQVKVVDASFRTRGKDAFLPTYYELLEVVLQRCSGRTLESYFPFLDEQRALLELETLELQKDCGGALLGLMKYLLEKSSDFPRFHPKTPTAGTRGTIYDVYEQNHTLDLSQLLVQLRAEGEVQLQWVLGLYETDPWLEETLGLILKSYEGIQSTYPGGVAQLIEDLIFIGGEDWHPGVYRAYTQWVVAGGPHFAEYTGSKESMAHYLDYAKNLVSWLGDDAASILSTGEINSFEERVLGTVFSDASREKGHVRFDLRVHYVELYGELHEDYLKGFERLAGLLSRASIGEYDASRAFYVYSSFNRHREAFGNNCADWAAIAFHFCPKAEAPRSTTGLAEVDNRFLYYQNLVLFQGFPAALGAHLAPSATLDVNPLLELSPKGKAFLESWTLEDDVQDRARANVTIQKFKAHLADPELLEAFPGVETCLKKRISDFENAVGIQLWREFLDVRKGALQPSAWLSGTNPATRMIVVGEAMRRILEGKQSAGELTEHIALLGEGQDFDAVFDSFSRLEKGMREDLAVAIPQIETEIRAQRALSPGLMPEGFKLHTDVAMDERQFNLRLGIFGVGGVNNTYFKLLHGGKTLVVPPLPTVFELKLMLRLFALFGTIGQHDLDLQATMAGHWEPDRVARVGSSILLSNRRSRLYAPDAFVSTHPETAARIMVRDAEHGGVRYGGYPYDVPEAVGRTDIMGQVDVSVLDRYKLLGTLAAHVESGRGLGDLMKHYESSLLDILHGHGLADALYETSWVKQRDVRMDDSLNHGRVVGRFAQASIENSPLRREVQGLIKSIQEEVSARRESIIAADPEEYERHLAF